MHYKSSNSIQSGWKKILKWFNESVNYPLSILICSLACASAHLPSNWNIVVFLSATSSKRTAFNDRTMAVKKALMQIKMQIATVAANFLSTQTMDLKSSYSNWIEEKQTHTKFKRVDRNCDALSHKIWVKSQHLILSVICVCIPHSIFDCYSFKVVCKFAGIRLATSSLECAFCGLFQWKQSCILMLLFSCLLCSVSTSFIFLCRNSVLMLACSVRGHHDAKAIIFHAACVFTNETEERGFQQ